MANTFRAPRAHLVMALCLPLAVLIGYFLAEPFDLGGLSVLALLLGLLSLPLLMKYHHPLLVVGWNSCFAFAFLPGNLSLWMVLAVVGLCVAVFNRAVNPNKEFLVVPSLTRALLCFAGVVVATAALTGGIGLRALGGAHYGGRAYFELIAAVAGYFAFTSERIPVNQAGIYVALFFLANLTALAGNLIYAAGPRFYFFFNVIPVNSALDQAKEANALWPTMPRLGGLLWACTGVYIWLLARHGLRGLLEYSKPWRAALFVLAVIGCLYSGFRTMLIEFGLMFAAIFLLEGWWRTRALPLAIVAAVVLMAVVLPQVQKLPTVVQRTLSFLPVKVDQQVSDEARYSIEWRWQIWSQALPQVPKYLIKGKGYRMDPSEWVQAQSSSSESSSVAMEYHNGPLSVVIPFGILGLGALLWFLGAALRLLYCNYRYGPPELTQVNTALLAAFAAKLLVFLFIFGSLHAEFFWFTGMAGLSVSLNGGLCQAKDEVENAGLAELEPA